MRGKSECKRKQAVRREGNRNGYDEGKKKKEEVMKKMTWMDNLGIITKKQQRKESSEGRQSSRWQCGTANTHILYST